MKKRKKPKEYSPKCTSAFLADLCIHRGDCYLLFLCFLILGKLDIAAFFLVEAAEVVVATVNGAGAALASDEIVDVARFDDFAAFFALDGVLDDFFHRRIEY